MNAVLCLDWYAFAIDHRFSRKSAIAALSSKFHLSLGNTSGKGKPPPCKQSMGQWNPIILIWGLAVFDTRALREKRPPKDPLVPPTTPLINELMFTQIKTLTTHSCLTGSGSYFTVIYRVPITFSSSKDPYHKNVMPQVKGLLQF